MAFPTQKQESFFYAHTQAFKHFGGVLWRISYDNLAIAFKLAIKGRREQRGFVALRSHYLFESHFCTPAAGWEKGQVEQGVLCRHLTTDLFTSSLYLTGQERCIVQKADVFRTAFEYTLSTSTKNNETVGSWS